MAEADQYNSYRDLNHNKFSRRLFNIGGVALAGLSSAKVSAATEFAPVIDPGSKRASEYLRPFYGSGNPGFIVAIGRGGEQAFSANIGLADLDHQLPITEDTPFHVASISKQFTGISIAMLERSGRLRIEDDIRVYLPFVHSSIAKITIANLLYHTSGLRDQLWLFQLAGLDLENHIQQKQIINLVSRQRALNFPPGTDFSYSNTGYTLLAEIVRVITGRSFSQFLSENVFHPLGMSRTFVYDDSTRIVPGRPQSYVARAGGGWALSRLNYETWGSTSVHSTARDLLRWASNFSDPKVGDVDLIKRMTTPGRLNDGTTIRYGFGIEPGIRLGRRALFHSGADAGFRSHILHLVDDDVTAVVLANSPVDASQIAEKVLTDFLGQAQSKPAVTTRPAPTREMQPSDLIGTFATDLGDVVTFVPEGDHLTLQRVGDPPRPVAFLSDGGFAVEGPQRLSFRSRTVRDGVVDAFDLLSHYGGKSRVYKRLSEVSSVMVDLKTLVGRYYSEELECSYDLTARGTRLIASTLWASEPIEYFPVMHDTFNSPTSYATVLRIQRDARGAPVGFQLNSNRAVGVSFKRVGTI